MSGKEQSEDIVELSDLYDLLEKDARLLVKDFDEGVGMWRSTGTLLLYFAVVGMLFIYDAGTGYMPTGIWRLAGIIASSGLCIAGLIGWAWARQKYNKLRRKYGDLFKAAKKLS